MNQFVLLLLAMLLIVLPIESLYLPINNLYARDTTTYDLITFTKVGGGKYSYTTLISTYPVTKNAITTVTIKITGTSSVFTFGCGQKQTSLLSNMWMGQSAGTIGYFAQNGNKFINSQTTPYGVATRIGDFVTMKINLQRDGMNVEFFKNSVSMGMAYGGLSDWGDIYIGLSLGQIGAQIQFYNYQINYIS